MDGTLFDTVPANQAAYAVALAPYGVSLSVEDFALHCNGRYYRDFLGELLGGDEAKIDAVHDAKLAASPALAGELGDASPGRLGKVLWITREQGSGTEQYLDSFISSNHIRVENRIEYNSNFAIKEVVKQGLGVCFLSRLVMLAELRSGELVELPVRSSYTRDFSYILPNDRPLPDAAGAFLDLLGEVCATFSGG